MKDIQYLPRAGKATPSLIATGEVLDMFDELVRGRKTIVVTDSCLIKLYGDFLNNYTTIVIEQGETNKNFATFDMIHHKLLKAGADRDTFLIGFGGGVITDITGFVASTYMRGIDFGFIATSLLAQIDASVGGKNGINLDGFKNIIGTFNQPEFVLSDTTLLKTLPQRELQAGLSEALKCGIIGDRDLFSIFLKNNLSTIKSTPELLQQIITRSIHLKIRLVTQDEHEKGIRKLLNLGHTFGHAIEKCSTRYNHGESVAIGTAIIAKYSLHTMKLPQTDYNEILICLKNLSLPTTPQDISITELTNAIQTDKKRHNTTIDLILIEQIGKCLIKNTDISQLQKITL